MCGCEVAVPSECAGLSLPALRVRFCPLYHEKHGDVCPEGWTPGASSRRPLCVRRAAHGVRPKNDKTKKTDELAPRNTPLHSPPSLCVPAGKKTMVADPVKSQAYFSQLK